MPGFTPPPKATDAIAEAVWAYATRELTGSLDPTAAAIAAAVWAYVTRELTVAMGLVQSEEAKGTLTADGSEQDLVDTSGRGKYEGYVDLTNMASGDTVVVKEYIKLKTAGAFILYATTTYTNAQAEPAIHAVRKLSEYGWKVTLQQTGGVNRTYDYEFLKEAQA